MLHGGEMPERAKAVPLLRKAAPPVATVHHLPFPAPTQRTSPAFAKRIHVLAIGGAHQFAHLVPVACELMRRNAGSVTIFVVSEADAVAVRELADAIGLPVPPTVVMALPRWMETVVVRKVDKLARLLHWSGRLKRCDLIMCAERTSTVLRRLFAKCPPILHIPHGAGDRAVGFERRFALFDHVLVAGEKDRDRLLASGHVSPTRCEVSGPIKLSAMLRKWQHAPRLFDNDRPTLLYNPHFSASLGSFAKFARKLIDAVARDGRFNLVVAPHIRMTGEWSKERKREWRALEEPGRIIVDTGSPACVDMTYTMAADLYIGDVSSQVYEFLVRPRPCLFVDAHGADWQDQDDYAMWQFGAVITPEADILAAIDAAFRDHSQYRAGQQARMQYAMAGITWRPDGSPHFGHRDPIGVAAGQVESVLAGL